MNDAPETFKQAIYRFKRRPYFWVCDTCCQPLERWTATIGDGLMWGCLPVYGDAPGGERKCPSCGGRRPWKRWAMQRYKVSAARAQFPTSKKEAAKR